MLEQVGGWVTTAWMRTGVTAKILMMDDMSNWVWLEPTGACTALLTTQHLLAWFMTIGVPEVWVSDNGTAAVSHAVVTTLQQKSVQ